jgi:hypothetical protein
MARIAMNQRKFFRCTLLLVSGLAIWGLVSSASHAQESHILVIPEQDGYGFHECMNTDSACGHIIADAWCEAHGFAAARAFGRAEDITATLSEATRSNVTPNTFIVACKD